jgi:hypothetical protein
VLFLKRRTLLAFACGCDPVMAGVGSEGRLRLRLTRDTLDEERERSKKNSLANFLIRWRIWSLDIRSIRREQRAVAIFAWCQAVKTFEITNEVTLVS